MTKEMVLKELENWGIKARVRFIKKSIYQSNRYKDEYITPEAWIYPIRDSIYRFSGSLITGEDWDNKEYRDDFFEMLAAEQKVFKK